MPDIEMSASDYQHLIELVIECGGIAGLEARLRRTQRRAREVIAFKTATEVLAAKADGVITRAEARKLLGLSATRTTRSRPT